MGHYPRITLQLIEQYLLFDDVLVTGFNVLQGATSADAEIFTVRFGPRWAPLEPLFHNTETMRVLIFDHAKSHHFGRESEIYKPDLAVLPGDAPTVTG